MAARKTESGHICACGCGSPARDGFPLVDHPHTDPGDGREECLTCGKWVRLVLHSCKRVPITDAAMDRFRAARAADWPVVTTPVQSGGGSDG